MDSVNYLDSVFLISSGLTTSMISINRFYRNGTLGIMDYGLTTLSGIGSIYIADQIKTKIGFYYKIGFTILMLMMMIMSYLEILKDGEMELEIKEIMDENGKLDINRLNGIEKNFYLNGVEPDRAYKELLNNNEYERLEQIRVLRQLEPQHEWMGSIIRNSIRKINTIRRFYDIQYEKTEDFERF